MWRLVVLSHGHVGVVLWVSLGIKVAVVHGRVALGVEVGVVWVGLVVVIGVTLRIHVLLRVHLRLIVVLRSLLWVLARSWPIGRSIILEELSFWVNLSRGSSRGSLFRRFSPFISSLFFLFALLLEASPCHCTENYVQSNCAENDSKHCKICPIKE